MIVVLKAEMGSYTRPNTESSISMDIKPDHRLVLLIVTQGAYLTRFYCAQSSVCGKRMVWKGCNFVLFCLAVASGAKVKSGDK